MKMASQTTLLIAPQQAPLSAASMAFNLTADTANTEVAAKPLSEYLAQIGNDEPIKLLLREYLQP